MPVGNGGKLDWPKLIEDSGLKVVSEPTLLSGCHRKGSEKYCGRSEMLRHGYRCDYRHLNFELDSYWMADAGVEGVILEIHKNWVDKDPIKSLQTSADFIKTEFEE